MPQINIPGLQCAPNTGAATPDFFVDPAAANDSGDGLTAGTAKKYINSALALTSAGSLVQLQDGTYPDHTDNTIDDDIVVANPGTSGSYVKVQAQTDGGVIIQADLGIAFQTPGNVYYEFHGLKWKSKYDTGLASAYIKFLRCAFDGGPTNGNVDNSTASSYQLFEDCWFYGTGGRINFLMYNVSNVIARRCVMRHDGGWGWGINAKTEPELTCTIYPNDGNPNANAMMQNCIIVDSSTYSPTSMNEWAPNFTNNTHGAGASNSFTKGCICFNSKGTAFGIEGSGSFALINYSDNAAIGGSNGYWGGFIANIPLTVDAQLDNCLAYGIDSGGRQYNATGDLAFKNSIITDNATQGLGGNTTGDYNSCWNNGGGSCGTNAQTYDPELNGLKYPTRIEAAGSLLTDGEGGGQIGPTIIKRRGVSGTLYGDAGYDTLTDDDLWPFPNEARIKADFGSVLPWLVIFLDGTYVNFVSGDMGKQLTDDGADVGEIVDYDNTQKVVVIEVAQDTAVTAIADNSVIAVNGGTGSATAFGASAGAAYGGNRGFCASGNDAYGRVNTLSRYIWQSLGYEVPDEYNLRD